MHSRISLNARLMEAARARLPSVTGASLYGRGVFTTLAIHRGRPFLWPEHWARLTEHAERAGVDHRALDEAHVGAALGQLIEANKVEQGRARVALLARAGRGVWQAQPGGARDSDRTRVDLLMMTGDLRNVPEGGLALTVSPYRVNTRSPLAGLKSLNYLDHLLSWEEARARDFDEAVVLNERGEVVSTTMANLFWVSGGTLYTPALAAGALAGTTRARLIALAGELGVPVVEGTFELVQLAAADEIFLTSAGLSVAIVTAFDFHRYTVAAGSVALRLREAFRQLTLSIE